MIGGWKINEKKMVGGLRKMLEQNILKFKGYTLVQRAAVKRMERGPGTKLGSPVERG